MCSVGRADVFSFGGNVFSFWPNVFTFWRNVFILAGQVFSFRWRALVGDRGRRDDGDVSTLSGQCVQFLARCVNFSGECVQFLAECVQFRGGCVHFGEECVQFLAVALVGNGARTEGEILRLRCAALGMTEAAGADRGRGWWVLAMTSMLAMQSVDAVLAVRETLAGMGESRRLGGGPAFG